MYLQQLGTIAKMAVALPLPLNYTIADKSLFGIEKLERLQIMGYRKTRACERPKISQQATIFTDISMITLLLYSYDKYFMSFFKLNIVLNDIFSCKIQF